MVSTKIVIVRLFPKTFNKLLHSSLWNLTLIISVIYIKIKLKFKDIGKIPTAQTTEYSTKGSLISTSEDIDFTGKFKDEWYGQYHFVHVKSPNYQGNGIAKKIISNLSE